MSNARRTVTRFLVAAISVVVAVSVSIAQAGESKADLPQTFAPARQPALIGAAAPGKVKPMPGPKSLIEALRPATAKSGPPVLPREIDLLSDIATTLLSGNATKLLADVSAELLSGNTAHLFSGNEPSLLSDNKTDLLSGNDTRLLSGNKPNLLSGNDARLLSGNKVQLFSNIKVEISFADSGNNNGNNYPPPPRSVPAPKPKKRAQAGAPDRDQAPRVGVREFSDSNSDEQIQRLRSRFEALDRNGDGLLSFEEFTSQESGERAVALQRP
jgi:hypothetical protein